MTYGLDLGQRYRPTVGAITQLHQSTQSTAAGGLGVDRLGKSAIGLVVVKPRCLLQTSDCGWLPSMLVTTGPPLKLARVRQCHYIVVWLLRVTQFITT